MPYSRLNLFVFAEITMLEAPKMLTPLKIIYFTLTNFSFAVKSIFTGKARLHTFWCTLLNLQKIIFLLINAINTSANLLTFFYPSLHVYFFTLAKSRILYTPVWTFFIHEN